MELPRALFKPKLETSFFEKKITPLKRFLYFLLFRKMKKKNTLLKSSYIFLYFLKRKLFLNFRKWKPKKLLIFHEVTFRGRKMKKKSTFKIFLIFFRKWKFVAPSLKKYFLYFRRELANPEHQKFHIFCLLRENLSNISTKGKIFL